FGRTGYGFCAYASSRACAARIPRIHAIGERPLGVGRGEGAPPGAGVGGGDTAGDEVAAVRFLEGAVGRVEEPGHVERRRVRSQEEPEIRLVPDRPTVDPRVVRRGRERESGEGRGTVRDGV